MLQNYQELLTGNGVIILSCPNIKHLAITIRHLMGQQDLQGIDDFHMGGIHRTSEKLVSGWLRSAGFIVEQTGHVIEERWMPYNKYTFGLAKGLWSYEFISRCEKSLPLKR